MILPHRFALNIPRRYPEDSSYIINEYLNRFYLFYQNEYGCMSLRSSIKHF